MMRAARAAAHEEAARRSQPAPLVIAVTVLTSMDQRTISEIGLRDSVADQVARLAVLAAESGMDGVVASPQEIGIIRRHCGDQFAIVTPGIRGGASAFSSATTAAGSAPASAVDDQNRTLTAAEALAAGASYIVVGRPIIAAADPRAAAEGIAAECRAHAS
jgi:orotidine-5'-phosphate decarboxylase